MADPLQQLRDVGAFLGDAVNWSRRNLPPVLNLDPIGALGLKAAELAKIAGAPETGQDIERASNIVSGQMAQTATDIVSAPTALYTLANAGVNAARPRTFDEIIAGTKDYGKPQLPGAEGALDITNKINTVGTALGERVANEPVDLQVLKPIKNISSDPLGNSAQLVGSLARIAGGLVPAPEAAVIKIGQLGKQMETGVKLIDAVTKNSAKALEFITPITFTPTKAGYAANAVAGAGITAGLEAILGDEPKVEQAVAETNEKTAAAYQGAKDVKNRQIVQAGMLPFEDWKDNAAVAAGIGGATVGALLLRRGMSAANIVTKPSTAIDAVFSDRLAPLRGTLEQIDPSTAKHFDAFSSRHSVDGSISTAVEHNFDSGRLPDAQVSQLGPVQPLQVTPHRVVVDKFNALPDPQKQQFSNLMNYATELDNRIDNLIQLYPQLDRYLKVRNPTTGEWDYDWNRLRGVVRSTAPGNTDDAIAVNLGGFAQGKGVKTVDLLKEIDTARSVPELAAMEKMLRGDYSTLTKYIENLGLRTADEADKFRKANINYSPTERDYGTNLWQRTRDAGSGRIDDMGDPITQRAQYLQTVISQAMKNQTRTYWMQYMWNARNQGDTLAKQLIERRATDVEASVDPKTNMIRVRHKDGKTNEYNADDVVSWRDDKGRSHVDFISDPLVRAALRQESPYAVNQAMYLMDKMRRWQQFWQTGPGTLVNTAFAPKSAAMTAFFGAIKKPNEVVGGPLDRALRYASGDKLYFPKGIPDLSNVLDVPQAIVSDTLSAIAHGIHNTMERSLTQNGAFSKMLGPGFARLVSDTSKQIWEDSVRFKMSDLGISHSAPLTDRAEYSNFMRNVAQQKSMLGATGEALKSVLHVLDQAHNIVSASPISAMVRNNMKRLTSDDLTKYAREYAADPGKRALAPSAFKNNKGMYGLSSALHMANTTLPYANVTIQAMADFARQLKKNPVPILAGTAIGVGLPTMMETGWNVSLGPEYTNYQYNVRTAQQQAQNLYFGVPGLPPEQGIEYPIDPFYRPFKVAIGTMVGAAFGLFDGSIFKPHNDIVKMRMQEIAMPRFQQAMKEAGSMSVGIQMPLPLEAGIAASGYIPGEISPFKSPFRKPSEHRLSGFDDERTSRYVNDNIFGIQLDRTFDEINRVIFGSFGDQIAESLRTFSRTSDAGAPISEAAQDVAQRETMRLKDGAKMFNGLLWTQSPKLSPYGVESTILHEKRTGIRNLTEALNEAQRVGMSGSRSRPGEPLMGSQQSMPADPVILQIAQQASILNRQLDKAFMAPMKAIQDQVVSIESSVKYSPKTQRQLLNELNSRLNDYQAAALSQIQLFEHQISLGLGRKVRLDQIRLEKGIDQFPPLNN